MSAVTIIVPAGFGWGIARALDGKKRGLTWRLKESLEDMEYADDICLVSHKYEHMQKKLVDLQEGSKKVGLQINPLKTEEIRVQHSNKQSV
jgi:hypothetical protein